MSMQASRRHGRLLRHLPLLVVLGRAPRQRIIIVRFVVVGATPSLTSGLPATAVAAAEQRPPPAAAMVAHAPTAPARLDGFTIRNDDGINRTVGKSQSQPRL
jgi:hypothetical protein